MSGTERMDPGELRMVREALGLTRQSLADMLGVREDTVRRWEIGRDLIPVRIRDEVEVIERYTARAVDDVVAALSSAPDPVVRVYITDEAMHAARPDLAHLPARWWRHVAYRAVSEVPGVAVVSEQTPIDDRVQPAADATTIA
jgi:transcriptional regulator with XRE-family HTH domain